MAATIVKAGQRKPLNVLGMPLTMLCEASETQGNWSLFEEDVPRGMGPPRARPKAWAFATSNARRDGFDARRASNPGTKPAGLPGGRRASREPVQSVADQLGIDYPPFGLGEPPKQPVSYCDTDAVLREFCGCSPA